MDIDMIKCPICKEILNLPVILPCGHTVCKNHVDKVTENKETKIMCSLCDEFYVIPASGFVTNRVLNSLLENETKMVYFGNNIRSSYNSAKETYESFEELLDGFNRIKNDPEMKIHTVINELKNKVDVRREYLKEEIDKKSLAMIEKLNEFEKDCKANVPNVKFDSKIGEKWERLKNYLRKHLDETRKKNVTVEIYDKCEAIFDETKSAIKELQMELIKYNENLFLNRLNDFDGMKLTILNCFGPIRLTVRLTVKELSKYKDIKTSQVIDSCVVNAFGVKWELKANIEQDESKNENCIGIYLFANQNPRIQNVKVNFYIEILDQFGMGNNIKSKDIQNVYKSDDGFGLKKYIKFDALKNNYNFYNIEKDSVTVQAVINRIEWV